VTVEASHADAGSPKRLILQLSKSGPNISFADRIFMFGLIQYNFCQEPQQLAFDLLAHKNHILQRSRRRRCPVISIL
jgi:hypothetical protein